LLQLVQIIYGKWLIWLTIANIFKFNDFYESRQKRSLGGDAGHSIGKKTPKNSWKIPQHPPPTFTQLPLNQANKSNSKKKSTMKSNYFYATWKERKFSSSTGKSLFLSTK
jgi:hypothetical protein